MPTDSFYCAGRVRGCQQSPDCAGRLRIAQTPCACSRLEWWERLLKPSIFFNSVACADSIDFLRVWFNDIVSRPYKSEGKPIDLYRCILTSVDKPGYEHPIAVRLYMARRHACMRLSTCRLLDILDEKIVPSISTDSEMLILCDPKRHKGLYIKGNLPDIIHWGFLMPNTKRHFIE